jgi:hypothetical protein
MQTKNPRQPGVQPKDRPFPPYARDYFNQLLQQYMLLLDKTAQKPPPSIAQLITDVKAQPDATAWSDIFALESAYLYAIPPERLPDEVQLARDRYRDVAGNDAYAAYAKTVPSSLADRTEPDLRSELMTLAERIRYLYTFVPPKENLRNSIATKAATLTFAAAIVGLLIYFGFLFFAHVTVVTIIVVMFVGQMGGFLSVQQRLQSSADIDPLFKELQLVNGSFSIAVIAPISGAIFAIVLYFMFAGGLMTGGLFPHFGPAASPGTPATGGPLDITQFLVQAAPTGVEDWGRLLVWAFIAGFAERFVPDVLTRLTGAKYSVGGDQSPGGTPTTRNAGSAAAPPVGSPPSGLPLVSSPPQVTSPPWHVRPPGS